MSPDQKRFAIEELEQPVNLDPGGEPLSPAESECAEELAVELGLLLDDPDVGAVLLGYEQLADDMTPKEVAHLAKAAVWLEPELSDHDAALAWAHSIVDDPELRDAA